VLLGRSPQAREMWAREMWGPTTLGLAELGSAELGRVMLERVMLKRGRPVAGPRAVPAAMGLAVMTRVAAGQPGPRFAATPAALPPR
jgi:hypothetical protein